MNEDDKYIFFYGGVYSQWSPHGFYDFSGKYYTCAEQYMMAHKAMTFGDDEIYIKVMNTDKPNEHKALGRQVKNFDINIWKVEAIDIVVAGSYFKFTQNRGLYDILKGTGNKVLVEASPTDKLWGIGMGENDENIWDSENWDGRNWLGISIMRVRMMLFDQVPFDIKYMDI